MCAARRRCAAARWSVKRCDLGSAARMATTTVGSESAPAAVCSSPKRSRITFRSFSAARACRLRGTAKERPALIMPPACAGSDASGADFGATVHQFHRACASPGRVQQGGMGRTTGSRLPAPTILRVHDPPAITCRGGERPQAGANLVVKFADGLIVRRRWRERSPGVLSRWIGARWRYFAAPSGTSASAGRSRKTKWSSVALVSGASRMMKPAG
jgi:hypothetical protein